MAEISKPPLHEHPRSPTELINNRVIVNSSEPRGAIGDYDSESGRFTLYHWQPGIFRLKGQLCEEVLKIPRRSFASSRQMSAAALA